MYYTEGRPAMLANQYHEDAWWKRLCGAIQKIYPHLEVTHTAERAMKFPVAQEKSTHTCLEARYLTHRPRHTKGLSDQVQMSSVTFSRGINRS